MRLVQATSKELVFHLAKQEKLLLLELLKLYPRIPPAHHRLSKSNRLPDQESGQHLLDEALAEQRQENKKHLNALLAAPNRFHETQTGCRLALTPVDLECLLQVLNDIRVGSWVRLGSPEEHIEEVSQQNAADVWAMELSGLFQMGFLAGGRSRPPRGKS